MSIVSDYAMVINFLASFRESTSNRVILHKIKREIILIIQRVKLGIIPIKVKAH